MAVEAQDRIGRMRTGAAIGWPIRTLAALFLGLYLVSIAILAYTAAHLDNVSVSTRSVTAESVLVGDAADYLLDFDTIDDTDSLLSEVIRSRFTASSGTVPVFGMHYFDRGMLWLRFVVPRIGGDDREVSIRIADPRAREARLVLVRDRAVVERHWAQDDDDRRSGLGSRVPVFHFERGSVEGAVAYAGFSSLSVLRGSVFVETRRAFEAWDRSQIVLPSILGGALVAIGLYLAITGLRLRQWPLVAAGAMSISMMTVIFGGAGLVHAYLLPGRPALADLIAYAPKPLAISFWLVFLVGYLRVWETSRHVSALLLLLALLLPFQSVLAAFAVGLDWDVPIKVNSSGPMLVCLAAGLCTLLAFAGKGSRPAKIFLLCWLPLIVGMFVRLWIIIFPTPTAALLLADDPLIDVVLSMIALAVALVIDMQSREALLRHDAEQKEQRFRAYSELAADSFFETDREGVVSSAAGPLTREIGLHQGVRFLSILEGRFGLDQSALLPLAAVLTHRRSVRGLEFKFAGPSGARWFGISASPWLTDDGAPAGMRGTIIDMTEQNARREREAERAKLVALGRLAGGIAHEVNNLLHPIINLARRVRDRHVRDEDGKQMLDLVIDSGRRAGEVVGGVLAVVSPQHRRGTGIPLSMAVERAVAVAAANLPPGISLESRIATIERPRLPLGEMLQVIGNLVQNARHASSVRGSIVVALQEADELGATILSVSDDGCGMDEALRIGATEPFVTSRPDGNGLGLPAVATIVEVWGGTMDIQSKPGKGTAVIITIPPDADFQNEDNP